MLSIEKVKNYIVSQGFIFVSAEHLESSRECKIEVICPRGHEYNTTWHSFSHQKCRCKKGLCNTTGNKLRKKAKEVISEFELQGYKFIGELKDYKNNKSKLRLLCENNHPRNISYNHFMKVKKCPDCNGFRRPYEYEEVKKIFEREGCILLEPTYINTKTIMKYQCVCGEDSCYIRLTDFLRGVRCKRCSKNEPYSYEEVINLFEKRGHTLLETEYKGSKTPHAYICRCGNVTAISIYNLVRGVRCKVCYLRSNRGENHPSYNPDLTDEERQKNRKYIEYVHWRSKVYQRDKYTCQCCYDDTGGNLVAHHLDGYHWCVERRTDVENGVTMCERCHDIFHNRYGYRNNTEKQFILFLESEKTLQS
ncbi:hypothetical protein [Oceanobacillus sp. FSL K6-0127]|uniref:HNH endonuclease n=1 Tax=Oceanobacillus sp. FSL K6-0127 TaxID=2921420 RepID=UPI0030ECBE8E